ncbi:MAG: hypothetical protein RSE14_07905 [Erythrobacter sp.]|uniref:helix-turn-helix domain-containing transcriptional regulator n=1 Tax=Erythrobacter sp. TaxID=1042 RepID=UPI002B482C8C|nr:hypothetical protein [Erythrobacter sp.]WRH69217.1 MAG: hypothetical protein RSE14_07905 [Erythrobacter sp.]
MDDHGSQTLTFDAADALDTPEAQAELLADALASGDAKVVNAVLGMIARATGPDGNPTLSTLMAIVRSAGLKLSAAA